MSDTFGDFMIGEAVKKNQELQALRTRAESAESRLLLAEKLATAVKGLIEMGESSEYARFGIPPGSDENSEPIIEGRAALSAWEGE